MSTKTSVGFAKEQIIYLRSPIWRGAVRQDQKVAKGNPYISGEYIIGQLNRAFGFDGWSVEITSMSEENIEQTNGRYKATYVCRVSLTVYAGGRTLTRSGVGAHAMVSRNLVDVVANGQASAYTKAIKNASITFGAQFGLNTVRGGRGWQNNTVQNHPIPPDLGISVSITAREVESVVLHEVAEPPSSPPPPMEASSDTSNTSNSYPLMNLIGPVENGAPTDQQFREILKKLDVEGEGDRESMLATVRKLVISDTAKTREAIDEVMA